MTNNRVAHHVSSRLSLRPPQTESLQRLVKAIAAASGLFDHERDLSAILKNLKEPFTTLEDFERDFPSLCFS
jgi:type III restriction enzyme